MAEAGAVLGLALTTLCGAAMAAPAMSAVLMADQPVTLCIDAAPDTRPVLMLRQLHPDEGGEMPGRIAVEADTGETTLLGLFGVSASPTGGGFLLPGTEATRCWILHLSGPGRAEVALERLARPEDEPAAGTRGP